MYVITVNNKSNYLTETVVCYQLQMYFSILVRILKQQLEYFI